MLIPVLVQIKKYKPLFLELVKRAFVGKYKGSSLGVVWTIASPLILLVIYTVAFSVVFESRWGVPKEGTFDYALILFASLAIFNFLADLIRESSSLLRGYSNIIKKNNIPLEIFPLVHISSSLLQMLVSLTLFLMLYFSFKMSFDFHIFLFPVTFFPLFLYGIGVTFLFSALGVFVSDLVLIAQHLSTVLMFASPVFYSIKQLSEEKRQYFEFNPLVGILENCRDVLVFNNSPDWNGLFYQSIAASAFLILALLVFNRSKRNIPDFL